MKFWLIPLIALGIIVTSQAEIVLREDWKEIPWALPVTQEHVSNPMLKLELHGPGAKGIKKSNHDNIPNDPFYIWSGKCERNWALSLSHKKSLIDLSAESAKVRWRSKQGGDRKLHLALRLSGDRWIISEQSDPASKDWREFEFDIAKVQWRYLNIITVTPGDSVTSPDLSKVDAIGFTDLEIGGGSKHCARLDWIEVHGKAVPRPKRKPTGVKTTRVQPNLPEGVVEHLGLTFATYGDRELKLDLYTTTERTKKPQPAIIFIHGGGWYKGNPSTFTPMAQQLAERGFVTANIEYLLSGEAPFPAAINDCKRAVRWLRANAHKYNIDPKRIGAVGGSAGGHLSGLLAATSPAYSKFEGDRGDMRPSSSIQAAVIMAGPMDLTTPEQLDRAQKDPRQRLITFMGGTWEEAKQNYIDASPNRHIDKNTPPMCFMDGEFDRPGERYIETIKQLDSHGIPHELHVIPNAPHPFWVAHPFFEPALDIVGSFFEKHLEK